MRDALTELGLAGKRRIGMDLIEVTRQPCKIENIHLRSPSAQL